jgi:hypothetical protein
MNFPKKAIVTTLHDGRGSITNDCLYIGKVIDRVVTIVDKLDNGFYLTNYYVKEFKDENHDYCRYGFIVVSDANIEWWV